MSTFADREIWVACCLTDQELSWRIYEGTMSHPHPDDPDSLSFDITIRVDPDFYSRLLRYVVCFSRREAENYVAEREQEEVGETDDLSLPAENDCDRLSYHRMSKREQQLREDIAWVEAIPDENLLPQSRLRDGRPLTALPDGVWIEVGHMKGDEIKKRSLIIEGTHDYATRYPDGFPSTVARDLCLEYMRGELARAMEVDDDEQ